MLAVGLPLSALQAQAPATKQDCDRRQEEDLFRRRRQEGRLSVHGVDHQVERQAERGRPPRRALLRRLDHPSALGADRRALHVRARSESAAAREPGDIDVYVGSNEFKGGQRIKVRRIVVHPKYDVEESPDNDIALLELAEAPAPGRTSIITLATPATEKDFGVPGKTVTAAGWGENEEGEFPKALLEVKLDIVDANTCNSNILVWRRNQWFENQVAGLRAKLSLSEETVGAMRKLLDNSPQQERVITENMICTGAFATRKDTCVGDSGGPLFAEISRGRFIQVGLTSFSEAGCGMAEQGLFGVYTRVAQYVDWIEQTAR